MLPSFSAEGDGWQDDIGLLCRLGEHDVLHDQELFLHC